MSEVAPTFHSVGSAMPVPNGQVVPVGIDSAVACAPYTLSRNTSISIPCEAQSLLREGHSDISQDNKPAGQHTCMPKTPYFAGTKSGGKSGLLGRPRAAASCALVYRQVFDAINTAPSGLEQELPHIATSCAVPLVLPPSSASSGSPSSELTGMSHLTITTTDPLPEFNRGSGELDGKSGKLPSAPISPTSPVYDWRSAFRVPMLSPDGRVLGYRQNSSFQRRNMQMSYGELGLSPPESPVYFRAAAQDAVEGPEFAAAASDPLCGFPDADSRVAGYLLGPVIGRGGFCTVRKALHLGTSLPVAFKIIDKGRLEKDPKDRDRVNREMRVMRTLAGHVNVIQLLECAETERFIYIIMEFCEGGSLLDHVRSRRRLPERDAAIVLQQLVHSLQHCHARGIVHRDIKLENVLLDGRGGVRLVDFGLAGYFLPGRKLKCHCGSPSYAAPEIVSRRDYLAEPVDVWSLGVVLFAMLAGHLPFHAKDKAALSTTIAAGIYKTPSSLSPEAADLISRMLTVDPQARITLEGIWAHHWVVGSPHWEGSGEGPTGLFRCAVDPSTLKCRPAGDVLEECTLRGADPTALERALLSRECSPLTATYHLLAEAKAAATYALSGRGGGYRGIGGSETTSSSGGGISPSRSTSISSGSSSGGTASRGSSGSNFAFLAGSQG